MVCAVIRVLWFAGAFLRGGMLGIKTGNLILTYDFLELSVYHFSGSVDISTDIFLIIGKINKVRHFNSEWKKYPGVHEKYKKTQQSIWSDNL